MMRNEGNNHGMAQQRTLPRPYRGAMATTPGAEMEVDET